MDLSKIENISFDFFTVEIVDPVSDYIILMKEIFDFDAMKSLFKRPGGFKLLFDGMNGVTGPYAKQLFCGELGLGPECIMNCEPKEDFGGTEKRVEIKNRERERERD